MRHKLTGTRVADRVAGDPQCVELGREAALQDAVELVIVSLESGDERLGLDVIHKSS